MANESKEMLRAEGDFPFVFHIEKAVPIEKDGDLIIRGVASTINVDHDNERMAKDALVNMAEKINYEGVPLRLEHNKGDNAVVGNVGKAWVDERNQLWIEAALDKSHPVSNMLYTSLKEGVRMGLSVGGRVKSATKEFVESVGKQVKTFYDVILDEVSVTYKPANYDSWLVTKSIPEAKKEWRLVRQQFLTEYPSLDYLQAFAKSVPDKAWHRVEVSSSINKKDNDMASDNTDTTKEKAVGETDTTDTKTKAATDTDTDTKTKAAADDTDTTKSISRAEFNDLHKAVMTMAKNMSELSTSLMKSGVGVPARDQNNGAKDKEDHEVAAKAEATAEDQANPKKKKPQPDPDIKAKAQDDTDTDTKTKGEKDTTETYDMDSKKSQLDVAIKAMQNAVKALADSTKESETTKAGSETETDDTTKKESEDTDTATETTEKSSASDLDKFVATVGAFADAIVQKNRKDGKRFNKDEYQIVADMIKGDSQFQELIQKMARQPGQKRSMVMGVPMMVTKEGKRYAISARNIDTVEKSEGAKPLNFKEAWKTSFSSASLQKE